MCSSTSEAITRSTRASGNGSARRSAAHRGGAGVGAAPRRPRRSRAPPRVVATSAPQSTATTCAPAPVGLEGVPALAAAQVEHRHPRPDAEAVVVDGQHRAAAPRVVSACAPGTSPPWTVRCGARCSWPAPAAAGAPSRSRSAGIVEHQPIAAASAPGRPAGRAAPRARPGRPPRAARRRRWRPAAWRRPSPRPPAARTPRTATGPRPPRRCRARPRGPRRTVRSEPHGVLQAQPVDGARGRPVGLGVPTTISSTSRSVRSLATASSRSSRPFSGTSALVTVTIAARERARYRRPAAGTPRRRRRPR